LGLGLAVVVTAASIWDPKEARMLFKRLSEDYEELPGSSEAIIYIAITRLMIRRLATA
jgi:hypothetical protein